MKQKAFNLSKTKFKPATSCISATKDNRPDPGGFWFLHKKNSEVWEFSGCEDSQ